jgi:hypothetical protein
MEDVVILMTILSILRPNGVFYGVLYLVHFVVIWYILWSFGTVCGHLVQFVVIWYSLWSFGTFCRVLVCSTEKNLAKLHRNEKNKSSILFRIFMHHLFFNDMT